MTKKKDLILFKIDDSTEMYTTVTKKYLNKKPWVKKDPNKIISIIPGKILEILVKEGQEVKKADTLLVLESMKMANRIKTPISAKVKKIYVTKGDSIPKGTLMFELE